VSNRAAVILAATLLLCAVIYAFATRYEIAVAGSPVPAAYVIDRWTGEVSFAVGRERWPVARHAQSREGSWYMPK